MNKLINNSSSVSALKKVYTKFIQSKGAVCGSVLVLLFFFIAFFAPFIANRLPFYWYDFNSQTTTYPLIRDFFSPAHTTEYTLELTLNYLLLFLPTALITWKVFGYIIPTIRTIQSRSIAIALSLIIASLFWLGIGSMILSAKGDSWLYYKDTAYPQEKDTLHPEVFFENSNNQLTNIIQDKLKNFLSIFSKDTQWSDSEKNKLAEKLRDAVSSELLISPEEYINLTNSSLPEYINIKNLGNKSTQLEWNRFILEESFPHSLRSFIIFRSSFLIITTISLIVLGCITYICIAGGSQFTANPRWIFIIILALLLSIPFGKTPFNDYTVYRELQNQGKGKGLFALIPYGPNEQGFGPHLPPSWFTSSPLITSDSILNVDKFIAKILSSEQKEYIFLREEINHQIPLEYFAKLSKQEQKIKLLIVLNTLIDENNLYQNPIFTNYYKENDIRQYLRIITSDHNLLTHLQQQQFNRLLLGKVFTNDLTTISASKWKKPQHLLGTHLLGTDESGRDVLVRIIYGSRVSLSVGFISITIATIIGLLLGSLAAYYGGLIDLLISRFMEVMMCFPSFFLILAIIAVLDKRSIINIMLVIGLTGWTGIARLIRGEILKQKQMDYVTASIALGASDTRTIFKHILPNSMAPVLVAISFGITGAILTEAGLSFIGFGVTPPTPTWGQLLNEARESPLINWWLAIFPGLVLFLGVISYNLVGEGLRDALDPRSSKD